MSSGPLNREQLGALIRLEAAPLITGYTDLGEQLQPNGFDLSLREIARFDGPASLGASNADRQLPGGAAVDFGPDDWLHVEQGPHLVTYNEVILLPTDLMALGRPRSSLLRMGVSLHTAVWDAGYNGRSSSLMVVHRAEGVRLQRNARLTQLVFFRLTDPPQQGYQGGYQGEGLSN